jgi:hypothetical protein
VTPRPHPQADEAARYVLGQLPPNARHDFELQLTQSAELRAIVQELEEGVEAVARAVPQRPPPPQTWNPIEQAIAREVARKIVTPAVWANWWRSGWAAAAACLVAFAGYAWWPKSKATPAVKPAPSEVVIVVPATESVSPKAVVAHPELAFPTNVLTVAELKPAPEVARPELASLRWQIASLQSQLEQLSDLVAQQRAILAEPGRFKFFPFAGNNSGEGSSVAPMSPEVQRAMFYAMARDLGWLPTLAQRDAQGKSAGSNIKTFANVDFVDLKVSQENAPVAIVQAAGAEFPTSAATTSIGSDGKIPSFLGESKLTMVFDKTVARSGPVSFWTASGTLGQQMVGATAIGENPTVVTIPTEDVTEGGLTVMVGNSNVLGHFFILRYPQPAARSP